MTGPDRNGGAARRRWIAPHPPGPGALLLFDGECALCHGVVAWLLAADREGLIRVAPLAGRTAAERLGEERRAALPNTLLLLTDDGTPAMRSDAVVRLLGACGGPWRVLGAILAVVPRPLRDGGYRLVAAVRKRVFGRARRACPLLPADRAERLLP